MIAILLPIYLILAVHVMGWWLLGVLVFPLAAVFMNWLEARKL